MSSEDVDRLIVLHQQLLDLVLRQQLADIENGISPSSRVEIASISRSERQSVKDGLRHLDRVLSTVHSIVAR